MSAPRIYLAPEDGEGHRLKLPQAQAHHLNRVLRLREGASLILFDGLGNEATARIVEIQGKTVLVDIDAWRAVSRESSLNITLYQGIGRGQRMDYAIQKAVELGVSGIIPLMSERTVVQLDSKKTAARMEHWRAVMIGACEQCGRNHLPTLAEPVGISSISQLPQGATGVVLAPEAESSLAGISPPTDIHLVIGPEGGLTATEIAHCVARGFAKTRFGPRILRTETAGPAVLASVQTLWGDLGK
ncbi:MAG: 16S rRNA (uracil(1498)-N(3))-methyltransferase [Gammaproteobacteria bacterium]